MARSNGRGAILTLMPKSWKRHAAFREGDLSAVFCRHEPPCRIEALGLSQCTEGQDRLVASDAPATTRAPSEEAPGVIHPEPAREMRL